MSHDIRIKTAKMNRTATRVPEYSFEDDANETDMEYPFVFHDSLIKMTRSIGFSLLLQRLKVSNALVQASCEETRRVNQKHLEKILDWKKNIRKSTT